MLKVSDRLNADFDHMVKQQNIIDDLSAQLEAAHKTIEILKGAMVLGDELTEKYFVDPDERKELNAKLTAAEKRVKELEGALADLITAPAYADGLKARILDAFRNKLSEDNYDPILDLSEVLDELEIK